MVDLFDAGPPTLFNDGWTRGRDQRMIERRFFLKLTGCLVAGSALEALPVFARAYADDAPGAAAVVEAPPLILQAPGTYRITGPRSFSRTSNRG